MTHPAVLLDDTSPLDDTSCCTASEKGKSELETLLSISGCQKTSTGSINLTNRGTASKVLKPLAKGTRDSLGLKVPPFFAYLSFFHGTNSPDVVRASFIDFKARIDTNELEGEIDTDTPERGLA